MSEPAQAPIDATDATDATDAIDDQSSDAEITASRAERKYLIEPQAAPALARTLERELSRHRFTGEGANPLPRARHYTTTIYFDTASGSILQQARAGGPHTKLRAREYYDLHPELTELATSASQLVRYSPVLWLELKAREGDHSRKHRVGIPKADVPRFFASGEPSAEMLAIQRNAHGDAADDVLRELLIFRKGFSEPLEARALVNYRRTAWQNGDSSVRITLDRDLGVFAPRPDLWTAERALSREALGAAAFVEPRFILELKHRGAAPDWIGRALAEAGAVETGYSKFAVACGQLERRSRRPGQPDQPRRPGDELRDRGA